MKKVLTFCASLAFLLGISSGANALIVFDFTLSGGGTLGVPDADSTTIIAPPSTAISDQLLFDILTAPATLISGTLVVGAGFLGSAAAAVTLHQETAASTLGTFNPPTSLGAPLATAVFSTSIDGLTDTYSLSALLPFAVPTRYFIQVVATTASVAGTYSVQLITVLPVPIPPAAVLFLSALAGLAGFSRIRRRKAVAT